MESNHEKEYKVIVEKDGLKVARIEKNKYQFIFSMKNEGLDLSSVLDFDLIKLIYDLNQDIYEKIHLEKINEEEAIVYLLMKPFFSELGFPQRYFYFHIQKHVNTKFVIFESQSLFSEKPPEVPEEAEMVLMEKMHLLCEKVSLHKINLHGTFTFPKDHVLLSFMEKFLSMMIQKIFHRFKDCIENYQA